MFFDSMNIKIEMLAELDRILRYWTDHTMDEIHGGFVGQRDHFNHLVPGATKGAVLNARILWTFSAAYNFSQNASYLKVAKRAYDYMCQHFIDPVHGGIYWELNPEGTLKNGRKQIYAQGFGIYGMSEYFKASSDSEALDHAVRLFQLIEKHSYDPHFGGYIEAMGEDWSVLEDMRLSPKDANEPKSMNTHLHILEPYTNLYRVWPDKQLGMRIKELVRVFLDRIINPQTSHFELFFDRNWEVKSNIVSYGHDIEGAWLLAEAAHELGDADLIKEVELRCVKMVDAVIHDGMTQNGAIWYEKCGDHLDTDFHWWPQAETLVGLVYAWKFTGQKRYLDWMAKTWHFICELMVDKTNGEWFWRVNENGIPYSDNDKAGFWKCPYHNSRALMEVINSLK